MGNMQLGLRLHPQPLLRMFAPHGAQLMTLFRAAFHQKPNIRPCALQRIQRCKQSLQLNNGRLYLTGAQGLETSGLVTALNLADMLQMPPAHQRGQTMLFYF